MLLSYINYSIAYFRSHHLAGFVYSDLIVFVIFY